MYPHVFMLKNVHSLTAFASSEALSYHTAPSHYDSKPTTDSKAAPDQ